MSRKNMVRTVGAALLLTVACVTTWSLWQSIPQVQAADVGLAKSVVAPAAIGFADAKTGSIKGKVVFKGTLPQLKDLHKAGDTNVKDSPVCAAVNMPNESLVIDEKGGNEKVGYGLANVCLYMQKAPEGYKAPPVPKETVDFDQKGCRFTPHCIVTRVGQTVLVKSGDPIAHNTHTNPVRGKGFNQVIPPNERKGVPLQYDKPERIPVTVKCDLHPFMTAYHCVQDHPFMVFTDAKGEFELKDIPAGKHTFIVWQETAGYLNKTLVVNVVAGKVTPLDLSYTPDKFKSK